MIGMAMKIARRILIFKRKKNLSLPTNNENRDIHDIWTSLYLRRGQGGFTTGIEEAPLLREKRIHRLSTLSTVFTGWRVRKSWRGFNCAKVAQSCRMTVGVTATRMTQPTMEDVRFSDRGRLPAVDRSPRIVAISHSHSLPPSCYYHHHHRRRGRREEDGLSPFRERPSFFLASSQRFTRYLKFHVNNLRVS